MGSQKYYGSEVESRTVECDILWIQATFGTRSFEGLSINRD